MPVDPNISLSVVGGKPQAPPNALEFAGTIASTMDKLNQVKLFNAKFAAQQKAGRILAEAPDIATGIKILQQDPDTAAFAPELAASAISTQNAVLDAAGREQSQGFDAFSTVLKSLPAVIKDPSQWGTLKKTTLEMASPAIRDRLAKSMDYLQESLDSVPPEKRTQLLVGWATAGGFGDAARAAIGTPGQMNVGDQNLAGVYAPPEGGIGGQRPGAFTPGSANDLAIPPTLANPESVPFKDRGRNPIGMTPPAAQPPAPTGPKAAAAKAAGIPSAPAEPSSLPGTVMSSLGIPLFTPETDMKAPAAQVKDVAGNPAGAEGQRVRSLMKDFTDRGKPEFDSANTLKGQVEEMRGALDTMARGGGWLVPGSGAELRYALGKLKTTLQTATGSAPDIDTEKVAKAEDFNKATQRMAGSLLNTMYGQQREAAETIRNITDKGVPGISNSLMGGKMILAIIDAAADRSIEQYQWTSQWAAKNNGDLRQADVEFNKRFPAKLYIDNALANLGMDKDGFTSPAAIETAYKNGLFTLEQYKAILKNKGKIYKE